jgi:flagellar biosynthesis/type III secretory pathway protein FliH
MGHLVKAFGPVVPAAALDVGARLEALVAQAEQQAAALVAAARAEADAIREQARRAGEAEGRARGEAEILEAQLAARRDAERIRSEALPAAQALAARMAQKIVGRAVALDARAMAEIAAQALTAARARAGLVVLRVHPEDLTMIEAQRPQLVARLAEAVELRVVADATVTRYGCIVDSPAGRLDARLETQLAALERAAFASPPAGREGSGR